MGFNQDWVLSLWRKWRDRNDPKPYTVKRQGFIVLVWMSLLGKNWWHRIDVSNGVIFSVSCDPSDSINLMRFIGGAQRRKIENALQLVFMRPLIWRDSWPEDTVFPIKESDLIKKPAKYLFDGFNPEHMKIVRKIGAQVRRDIKVFNNQVWPLA